MTLSIKIPSWASKAKATCAAAALVVGGAMSPAMAEDFDL